MSRKDLPAPTTPNWGQRVNEELRVLMGKGGPANGRAVTVGDLAGGGTGVPGGGGGGGGGSTPYEPDLTPPPTPTGFTLDAAISNVFIEHDAPLYSQGHGHSRTQVFGAKAVTGQPLPTFSDAVLLTEFTGIVFAYPTDPATHWRMWIKWRTVDMVESVTPAGGVNGLAVRTGEDVRPLLDAITQAAESPTAPFSRLALRAGLFYIANDVANTTTPLFSVVTAPIMMNGVAVPTGVYMRDAFVMNGSIVNAKIGNLAVDNAKIANLSVSKLLAGSMVVGQWISSASYVPGTQGWHINAAGNAEFNNVTVRGTVYATAGSIGGILIGSGVVQSANYSWNSSGFYLGSDGAAYFNNVRTRGSIMGGAYTAYAWPAAGQTGFYLGAEGLLLGNGRDGRGVEIQYNGNIYAPGFSIINGNASFYGNVTATSGTFYGDLSAAGGTFSGVLTAAAVNAVNTANIAGQAVTTLGTVSTPLTNYEANAWRAMAYLYPNMPTGGTGVITFASVQGVAGATDTDVEFRLRNLSTGLTVRQWTAIRSGVSSGGAGGRYSTDLAVVDASPAAGVNTYVLESYRGGTFWSAQTSMTQLVARR